MRVGAGIAALTAAASLSLGSIGLAAPTAHAATTGSPSGATGATGATEETVTLRLAPGNASAYRGLVSSFRLSRAARSAALANALPTDATRQSVEQAVLGQGFRIVGETAWTITAAAPARVAGGFITATKGRGMTGSDTPLATGPLAGLVTHVIDGSAPHLTMHPLLTPATLTGAAVRTLYGAPVGPATSTTPLSIATIQFSGWNDSDLGSYANLLGVTDPRTNGQYTAVSVLGTDPSTITFADEAMTQPMDAEVALDQESLLATAPHVKQRAYFAPNTDEGFFTAIEQVA
ncbi:MAG: kumamolisin, partial [Frankiaceae bacterium]|nr:kumamolisin [Frankiaceae bacterium]